MFPGLRLIRLASVSLLCSPILMALTLTALPVMETLERATEFVPASESWVWKRLLGFVVPMPTLPATIKPLVGATVL